MKAKLVSVIVAAATLVAGCNKFSSSKTAAHADGSAKHQEEGQAYYTCPMHPSVHSAKPGACPVCGMALVKKSSIAGSDSGMAAAIQGVTLSPTQRVIANVSAVKAVKRMIGMDIACAGIVSYAEPAYRHISMRFPGRLDKLYLTYTGQTVRKGDPVADVYSPEAISAQQEYLLALDSYERASGGDQSFAVSARQLLEQSKQKLLQWDFTGQQIARLDRDRRVEQQITIHSPVSGTVVKKSVDPQHYASAGDDMYDVVDLSTVWILLDVYEQNIRFIVSGEAVEVTTEAYPAEKFTGKVAFVDPVLNPETRTIRVRAEFANREGKLKPNMFVHAAIAAPGTNVLAVPSTAVLSTGKRAIVWVEVGNNTFEPRDVVTGVSAGGYTAILDGLAEGQRVVETGGFLLDSESQLSSGPSGHE